MTPGDLISDRYRVKSHIGSGGMQDVYLASDTLLEYDVAIKTPQAGQVVKKFASSAVIAARVNNYNVAKTLDYIEKDDRAFLVEEFVPGETLDAKLARFGVIDPHLGARVFLHLAKGVMASHHSGVIHRDLKPSNIIVEDGINIQNLKITDFGIATLTEEVFSQAADSNGDLTRSTSGTIRGALPFMSPEMMFRQPGEHPGKPTDIWSLGAMMFRLLTGEFPFGVYLQAAVNVQNRKRKDWPSFMTSNRQFQPLSIQLQKIIEHCLTYEVIDRPTADALVIQLAELCFINIHRTQGVVNKMIQNNYSGFATDQEGEAFFSIHSSYGPHKAPITAGTSICYSRFPGFPKHRGHPIVVMK